MTSFTLSAALRYADYTKYRLLNLFLFASQICGYLRFGTICNVSPVCTPGADLSCAACILHHKAEHLESNQGHRARPCASTIDAILRIKTPPDEKGQKSGGVPNVVWKAFGVFLLTPCYTIYYLKRTMWTKRTNFYFSFIHL